MANRNNNIRDDEFRVIGASGKKRNGWWKYLAAALVLAGIAVALYFAFLKKPEPKPVEDVFDQSTVIDGPKETPVVLEPLGTIADSTKAYTEHIKRTINDIPLDIYIPHNAIPSLAIGTPDIYDKSIVFVTQAADIRADNGKINGAFVLAGEPLAWGLSKKGYVAIIDGIITVGVSENSPLFEEATEKGGYFFRQYALVDNRSLVENEPKGKSIRKAICQRADEIIVVFTENPESFHDFSQALIDLGVENAVYLVGSEFSYGYFRDIYDHFTQLAEKQRGGQKFENYIVWRAH